MTTPPPLPAKRPAPRVFYWLLGPAIVSALLLAAVSGLTVFGYFKTFSTPNSGMAPAVCKGDMIAAEALSLAFRGVKRGEIIIFAAAEVPALKNRQGGFWITRVVALPGDRFQLKNQQVWINGARAAELKNHEYEVIPFNGEGLAISREIVIPEGQCVVLGDNTHNSLDSRYWGVLPVNSIRYVYAFHCWKSSDRSLMPGQR